MLKDNSEEVLQGLVPHIGLTLDCLAESQIIGVDKMVCTLFLQQNVSVIYIYLNLHNFVYQLQDSTVMEIGRALLKCESEIAATHNWRLVSLMHSQLEILPKYFPSHFIYSYFVPMAFFRILHAVSLKNNHASSLLRYTTQLRFFIILNFQRPIPVRLSAGTLYLFLLRYNMKPMQRVELRIKLYSELANNPSCYVRMMFVRLMIEALEIFSSVYFKKHFFTTLMNLAEDPVANIRLKVVSLLPQLRSLLRIPADKKLLTVLESTIAHLINSEKDRDVLAMLTSVVKKLDDITLKYDGRTVSSIKYNSTL